MDIIMTEQVEDERYMRCPAEQFDALAEYTSEYCTFLVHPQSWRQLREAYAYAQERTMVAGEGVETLSAPGQLCIVTLPTAQIGHEN
jgi:hypothetical protein